MKVLVSKINPKEIEEKIAKAESVTQTLYKKESNLKKFESVTSLFAIVLMFTCGFYTIYVMLNWITHLFDKKSTIQVWAALFLILAVHVCTRVIEALIERKFKKYNEEIDSVLLLLNKMKKLQNDFHLQEQIRTELSLFNSKVIVGRINTGEIRTLYVKIDDHMRIVSIPMNAFDEDSNTVDFSHIDDEYTKVSQELDTCFEKIKERYGRKALDNPRN